MKKCTNTSSHILSQFTAQCPNSHVLSQFTTQHKSYACDGCHLQPPQNTILFGCQECNYDLCESCCFDRGICSIQNYRVCSAIEHINDEKNDYNDIDDEKHYNDGAAARLFYKKTKLWDNGQTLKVYFIDGHSEIQQKVLKIAQKWSKYCNIIFIETKHKDESDIRIAFDKNKGSWSYIGKDANKHDQTMNFGWFHSVNNPNNMEYNTTTLHEFGHAIGFMHEHLHPMDKIPYDKDKVYKHYEKTNNWDKKKVDSNVLKRLDPIRICGFEDKIDKDSIMLYAVDPSLLKEDHDARFDRMTVRNHKLSLMDKCKVYRFYPFSFPKKWVKVQIKSKDEVRESFQIANRGRYDCNIYDKYCNKSGKVRAHHPTNGILIRFDDNTSLWYEPISMEILKDKHKNDKITIDRLFVGDHIRIIGENSYHYGKDGIIKMHDCGAFDKEMITVALKPYEDRLIRLDRKEIRKLESHEIHTEKLRQSSNCFCRAMLITSMDRREDALFMKKGLRKKGDFVMVNDEDIIIFDANKNDLNKEKLLNAMQTMFNDDKRQNFIVYYSGQSQLNTGDWYFDGEYDQFSISWNNIIDAWQKRKYKTYFEPIDKTTFWKCLIIVSDCNYSGAWVDYGKNAWVDYKMLIQTSCRASEECQDGIFTKIYAPMCMYSSDRKWSAGKWVYKTSVYLPKAFGSTFTMLLHDGPKSLVFNTTRPCQPCTTVLKGIYDNNHVVIAATPTHHICLIMVTSWSHIDLGKTIALFHL